ncbi:hypothetical protein phytr_2680 [Candidatus Phycorickettsia trachydisci]|uniref:Uncharacterized protein n=1 Tax=Candidatus Phycorickettsia trachydisci TaxID=2115978 RepID=A0A2P1P7I3_9RICK|nr:hypothetical protein phytr_2680 [Candidatus Phycorickettsia trachydisci]
MVSTPIGELKPNLTQEQKDKLGYSGGQLNVDQAVLSSLR